MNYSREDTIEKLKWEAAMELDLIHKVLEGGWGELTARETGKIGGILASKLKHNEIYD